MLLHPDRLRLGPFAVGSDGDVALDGVQRVRVHAFGKLVVVEGLCRGDRVARDLQFAIGKRRQKLTEQIDTDAVGRLVELLLDRCRLQSAIHDWRSYRVEGCWLPTGGISLFAGTAAYEIAV